MILKAMSGKGPKLRECEKESTVERGDMRVEMDPPCSFVATSFLGNNLSQRGTYSLPRVDP